MAHAKARFGLGATAPVVRCDEAGRAGFWLHRFLQAQGISNSVVDSSSIEVNRRQRRAKSDGLDVRKLLSMLMRYQHGERQVWQVVKVPSGRGPEDQRHLHRDLETLKQERASTTTRISASLSSQGLRVTSLTTWPELTRGVAPLGWVADAAGACGVGCCGCRLHSTCVPGEQIAEVEVERRALLETAPEASIDKVRQLMQLKGMGINGAWLLAMAFFGWRWGASIGVKWGAERAARRRRITAVRVRGNKGSPQVGNRHVRWMTTELAWSWAALSA